MKPPMFKKIQCIAVMGLVCCAVVGLSPDTTKAQSTNSSDGPDPREIPLPPIKTNLGPMPGVNGLAVGMGLPDALTMNEWHNVARVKQWKKRREEIKRILEYYAVGQI